MAMKQVYQLSLDSCLFLFCEISKNITDYTVFTQVIGVCGILLQLLTSVNILDTYS